MGKITPANHDPARPLPDRANLEHLKKEAKQRLRSLRLDDPGVTLSAVQLIVAREYGFSSWRRLIAYVKAQSDIEARGLDQQRAARAKFQDIRDGMEALGRGDYQTAVEHFRQAEAAHPTFTLSLVQYAVTKQFGENVWRDLFAYIKSLPDKYQLRPTDEDVSNAFNDGLEAAGKGKYQIAVEHFRRALRERPVKIRAHYYLGRALIRLRLYDEAIAAFEELLKFDPENLPAHYEIAKLSLTARNYPRELLGQFDFENLLANYEIGARCLSPQNYADGIAKYKWLKSQSENSAADLDDSGYELFPDEPRGGNLAQNPFHRAYAAKLAYYLLDLIPPRIAEQYGLPYSKLIFDGSAETSRDPRERWAALIDDQSEARKPMTILYNPFKEMAKYTEIARINRLEGTVVLSAFFDANGGISGIRVVKGLPDGLTRRAVEALKLVRVSPASLNGAPVGARETIEFDFNLD
ncbi:MAG: TonB family protein [Chloracidobacterium sp.]|nr:TonB family protein [Chloracidobacterium sp.]